MRKDTNADGTEMDHFLKKLDNAMLTRKLDGMTNIVKLTIALGGIRSIWELLRALKKRNRFGKFELLTKDARTYHRLMGRDDSKVRPTLYAVVARDDSVNEVIQAINELQLEIQKNSKPDRRISTHS